MKETFEEKKSQDRPRNKWEVSVRKDANQLLGIRNRRLMANKREDWDRKLGEPGLSLCFSAMLTDRLNQVGRSSKGKIAIYNNMNF